MSNHRIIFLGNLDDNDEPHKLTTYANDSDEIYIQIDMGYNEIPDWICLDRETAIKLTRVLKAEISKLS